MLFVQHPLGKHFRYSLKIPSTGKYVTGKGNGSISVKAHKQTDETRIELVPDGVLSAEVMNAAFAHVCPAPQCCVVCRFRERQRIRKVQAIRRSRSGKSISIRLEASVNTSWL
jgi:hypothetical protein